MTRKKLPAAARRRKDSDGPDASRETLLAALELSSELAASDDMPAHVRQRAIADIVRLAAALDLLDANTRAAKPVPVDWSELTVVAS